MCGIAGIVLAPNQQLADLRDCLNTMAEAMDHRGPDDQGIYISPDEQVGFANCRLAIRDLSPAGHMPMSNATGTAWITYNGEIYNATELRIELESRGYHFASRSDTEVILHGYEAWGEDVVKRLRGMFAFAIVRLNPSQNSAQKVFLARDHLGIKPLCYAQTQQGLIFASELKAILASGLVSRQISAAGLAGYLMMGSVPNPLTIYQEIHALEPSCCFTMTVGQPIAVKTVPYWHLPLDTVSQVSYSDAVEQTRTLLLESVRIRLVSDVPLGAFLSGGLDSSSVVALMRQATDGPIRTCSMVFEEAEYSEAPFARAMAESVGAEHYERVITADDLVHELDHILAAMDQPTVDGVNTYFVSQTAKQAGLTVALSGIGGDELFGGYRATFQGVPQMFRLSRLSHALPGGSLIGQTAIRSLGNRQRWAKLDDLLTLPPSLSSAYLARRGLFSLREVRALLSPELWHEAHKTFNAVDHVAARADGNSHAFEWVSRAELRTYTHHQLLRDTDVMSMAHSLEVREPLLDRCLVEAVLRLPTALKTQGTSPKPLLVQAVGQFLPPLVRDRRDKRGFLFPFDRWMRERLRDRTKAALQEVQATGWLQPKAINQVWDNYLLEKIHWSRVWAIFVLANFHMFTEDRPPASRC